jgi:hypothetical protein
MQKLALMMAVMMLGMSPAHGCSTSADPGSQGVRGQAEMMLPPSMWSGDDGKALTIEGRISSTTEGGPACGARRVPGRTNPATNPARGRRPGEDRERDPENRQGAAKENLEEKEYKPGSGEKGQGDRPEREAAQKAAEALKKGADATRGRGQRKSRLYQGAGARN